MFEQNYARHGFPCYDEPLIKANFIVSITHKSKYHTVVSNMNKIDSFHQSKDLIKTTFYETPVASTYLIAFAITDFAMNHNKSESNDTFSKTIVGVISRPDRITETNLTLESGIKFIYEIGRYVDVPFTLDKIDQIAIPTFGGAMENWGLVVYTLVMAQTYSQLH